MSHYNEQEIEGLSDSDLMHFVAVLKKMLVKAKNNHTKAKIALDQARRHLEVVQQGLDNDDWEMPCYTLNDFKMARKKADRLEFKVSQSGHEVCYYENTLEKAETQQRIRLSVKHQDCRYLVEDEIRNIFDEE